MDFANKVVFTVDEVGEIMNVHRNIIIDLVDSGYIKAIILRGRHITKAALMEFLEKYSDLDIERELYGRG